MDKAVTGDRRAAVERALRRNFAVLDVQTAHRLFRFDGNRDVFAARRCGKTAVGQNGDLVKPGRLDGDAIGDIGGSFGKNADSQNGGKGMRRR